MEVETEAAEAETPQTETVTFTRYTYTVSFAGDAYFADHVFYLSEEQKELAENYASNLTLFFGAASGTAMAINLSDEVLAYRPLVSEIAARYGMSDYVELILAVMMQESGGRGGDPMQASESGYNTRFPRGPGTITDPEYSIECGIQALRDGPGRKPDAPGRRTWTGSSWPSRAIITVPLTSDWAMERDRRLHKGKRHCLLDMMCAGPAGTIPSTGTRSTWIMSCAITRY